MSTHLFGGGATKVTSRWWQRTAILLGVAGALVLAGEPRGGKADYVGGTTDVLEPETEGIIYTVHPDLFLFQTRKTVIRVPYERINLLEYGQNVSRRYALAILISPLLLLSKKRAHFLTVGFQDEFGRQQAMVFKVDKKDVRAVLAALEARTGLRVQFQDEEARKAGKG